MRGLRSVWLVRLLRRRGIRCRVGVRRVLVRFVMIRGVGGWWLGRGYEGCVALEV